MQIERTAVAQQHFDSMTDGLDRSEDPMPAEMRRDFELLAREPQVVSIDSTVDMVSDDTPLACGLENPEGCEACD